MIFRADFPYNGNELCNCGLELNCLIVMFFFDPVFSLFVTCRLRLSYTLSKFYSHSPHISFINDACKHLHKIHLNITFVPTILYVQTWTGIDEFENVFFKLKSSDSGSRNSHYTDRLYHWLKLWYLSNCYFQQIVFERPCSCACVTWECGFTFYP